MTDRELVEFINNYFNADVSPNVIQNHINKISEVSKRYIENPFYMITEKPIINASNKSISGFALSREDDSIPLIVGIDRNKNLVKTMVVNRRYASNTGVDIGSRLIKMQRIGQLSDQARKWINENEFRDGLDLDNFKIVNWFSDEQPRLEDIVPRHGVIVPLNSREGVFIPKFVSFSHNMSLEREVAISRRYLEMGYDVSTFHRYLSDRFPFPVYNLLNYQPPKKLTPEQLTTRNDVERNALIRGAPDGSISYNYRTEERLKMVIGTASIQNQIYFNYLLDKILRQDGLITREIQPGNNGMHINVAVFDKNFNPETFNKYTWAYFDVIGRLLFPTIMTNKRLAQATYNDPHSVSSYSPRHASRGNFRTERLDIQILEIRTPHSLFDIGHLANQLIFANKAVSDIRTMATEETNFNRANPRFRTPSDWRTKGVEIKQNESYLNWIAKDILGLQGEGVDWFKSFVKNYCAQIR